MLDLIPLKGLKLAPVLKKQVANLEKQQQKQAIVESSKNIPDDFEEFASQIYVRSGGELVPFLLFDLQKTIISSIKEYKVTQFIKSRQMGLTELLLLYLAFLAVKNPAFTGIYISLRHDLEVKSAAERYRKICLEIERVYKVKRDIENLYSPSFASGGRVLFRAGLDPDNAIGEPSVSFIVYDEAAMYDLLKIFNNASACLDMVGDKARQVIVSTPKTLTDDYAVSLFKDNPLDLMKLIEQVREFKADPVQQIIDNKGWSKLIVHWKAHPLYGQDPLYLEKKIAESPAPKADVLRERDLCFDATGVTVFSPKLINQVLQGTWEREAIASCRYYLSLDPQFGGDDFCVCSVIKHVLSSNIFHLVDWYRKRSQTKDYHLSYIYGLIDKYSPIKMAIETNAGGKIYYEDITLNYPGVHTVAVYSTRESKKNMISRLTLAFERELLLLPDAQQIRHELSSFVDKNGKLQANGTNHDDIVMSLALGTNVLPLNIKDSIVDVYTNVGVRAT